MVHNPDALTPRCRLQMEGTRMTSTITATATTPQYTDIIPEHLIADAIRDRTDQHLRAIGRPISPHPIVMRAEYAFAPNLTIIDTPGFILKAPTGESETTPEEIMAMVKQQCEPAHRLILFLQQSSVEWASSLWMHVVQSVDPGFTRTIMVSSKFDNRLKEFSERWELEKYLSASGYLPANVQPFFVALPKERSHSSSSAWRKAIQKVDESIKKHVRTNIEGGFDEQRFGGQLGFGHLKQHLEGELAQRYRDAAPYTLALLKQRCCQVEEEVYAMEKKMNKACDVGALRRNIVHYVLGLVDRMDSVIRGKCVVYADLCEGVGASHTRKGCTTKEERSLWGGGWGQGPAPITSPFSPPPTADTTVAVHNTSRHLFGAAAFERCIQEFSSLIESINFPPIPRDVVANMLLAHRTLSSSSFSSSSLSSHDEAVTCAAQELVRVAAYQTLSPLLDTVCTRLTGILHRTFEIAMQSYDSDDGTEVYNQERELLCPAYTGFHASLLTLFSRLLGELEREAKGALHAHLHTITGHFHTIQALEGIVEAYCRCDVEEEVWEEEEDDENPEKENNNKTMKMKMHARPATTPTTIPETPSPEVSLSLNNNNNNNNVAAAARRQAVTEDRCLSPEKARVFKAARLVGHGETHGMFISGPKTTPTAGKKDGTNNKRARKGAAPPRATHKTKTKTKNNHSNYVDVCVIAERLFASIKKNMGSTQGPVLKSVFIEPLYRRISSGLCSEVMGKTDAEFMMNFTSKEALQAMEEERVGAVRRLEGLNKMAEEFGALIQVL